MTFLRPAVGLFAFGFCFAASSLLSGAPATELRATESPKEIASRWRFVDDKMMDSHFWNQDAPWTFTETGAWISGASFERVWNFYAAKCGIEKRFDAKKMSMTDGTSDVGNYVLLDTLTAETRATTFHLRNDAYTVTVLIWLERAQAEKSPAEKVFCSLTITTR